MSASLQPSAAPDSTDLEQDQLRLHAVDASPAPAPKPAGRWFWLLIAVLGVVIIAAGVGVAWHQIHPPPGIMLASGKRMIDPRGGARSVLPRSDFVVGWSAVPDALHYSLRVSHPELGVLHEVTGLSRTRYRIPAAALSRVAEGDQIQWQVTAEFADGEAVSSRIFTSTLGD